MTLLELMDTVNDELRQIGGQMMATALTATMMARHANRGARLLAQETHCLQAVKYFTTTVDEDYYTLDSMMEITRVVYDTLPLDRMDEALDKRVFTNSATPSRYSFEEPDKMRLFPPPNAAKVVYYFGYRWPTDVSAVGDSIDLPPALADLCVDYVMYRAVGMVQPEMQREKYDMWRAQVGIYLKANQKHPSDPNQRPLDTFFQGSSHFGGPIGLDLG